MLCDQVQTVDKSHMLDYVGTMIDPFDQAGVLYALMRALDLDALAVELL